MNHTLFTVEEENLICAFNTISRATLIRDIRETMPFIEPSDAEMLEVCESVIRKLGVMTDAEFSGITFTPAYDDDESEV